MDYVAGDLNEIISCYPVDVFLTCRFFSVWRGKNRNIWRKLSKFWFLGQNLFIFLFFKVQILVFHVKFSVWSWKIVNILVWRTTICWFVCLKVKILIFGSKFVLFFVFKVFKVKESSTFEKIVKILVFGSTFVHFLVFQSPNLVFHVKFFSLKSKKSSKVWF